MYIYVQVQLHGGSYLQNSIPLVTICWTVSLAMHTNTYAMEKTSDRSDMKTLVCVHGQKEEKM